MGLLLGDVRVSVCEGSVRHCTSDLNARPAQTLAAHVHLLNFCWSGHQPARQRPGRSKHLHLHRHVIPVACFIQHFMPGIWLGRELTLHLTCRFTSMLQFYSPKRAASIARTRGSLPPGAVCGDAHPVSDLQILQLPL